MVSIVSKPITSIDGTKKSTDSANVIFGGINKISWC